MSGSQAVWTVPQCAHGRSLLDGCGPCCEEREAANIEHRRVVDDPAQRITDALVARRPWFKRCGLCRFGRRGPDLVQDERHDFGCPFIAAMETAKMEFTIHVVERQATQVHGASRPEGGAVTLEELCAFEGRVFRLDGHDLADGLEVLADAIEESGTPLLNAPARRSWAQMVRRRSSPVSGVNGEKP